MTEEEKTYCPETFTEGRWTGFRCRNVLPCRFHPTTEEST
jgi:hypothetical protein